MRILLLLLAMYFASTGAKKQHEACYVCEEVVQFVDTIAGNENATDGALHFVIDEIMQLPTRLHVTIVQERGAVVHNDPHSGSQREDSTSVLFGPVTCVIRFAVVEVLEQTVDLNDTMEQLMDERAKVCDILPFDKHDCEDFIEDYGSQIIEYIFSRKSAHSVCKAIHARWIDVRPPQVAAEYPYIAKKQPMFGFNGCAMCQGVLALFDYSANEDGENATVEFIQDILDKICSYLPVSTIQPCKDNVELYTPMVVKDITSKTPEEFCTGIRICDTLIPHDPHLDDPAGSEQETIATDTEHRGMITCKICDWIVNYLEDMVKQNATIQDLSDEISKICDIAPFAKKKCERFTKTYGPEIIKLVFTLETSHEVCSAVEHCTKRVWNQK